MERSLYMSGPNVQRNEAGREFAQLRRSDFAFEARSLQREKLVFERYYNAAYLNKSGDTP